MKPFHDDIPEVNIVPTKARPYPLEPEITFYCINCGDVPEGDNDCAECERCTRCGCECCFEDDDA